MWSPTEGSILFIVYKRLLGECCILYRQCPQTWRQYRVKNKAAIALQCKLNVKRIAAFEDKTHLPVIFSGELDGEMSWKNGVV